MDTKLQQLSLFLKRYALASQSMHAQPEEAQVKIEMLAKDVVVTIYYLAPGAQVEPDSIVIGNYWVNGVEGSPIRKCVSNVAQGMLTHTYIDVLEFVPEFGQDVVMLSESIDVGPGVPLPTPAPISAKGSWTVNNGVNNNGVMFTVGQDGFALVSNSMATLGLSWQPIVTLNGIDTLQNKTLINPVISGTITGNAVIAEDNMVSNSASRIPTQRSVKQYVDASISGIKSVSCLKLNIVCAADGIHCQLDANPVYAKGTELLSHDISNVIVPGTTSVCGNVTYEVDATSIAVGVSPLTIGAIVSTSLLYASIGKAVNVNADVVGQQLQTWLTDLNGVPVSLSGLPLNSMVSILISFV